MTFWKWQKTAGSNASADATINWAEGQSPSSVNDSARAMMAAAAKFRDDLSGALVTAGSATAYTVASNQLFTALQAGLFVAFTPHATNGAVVTLNVDGLGAKPLRTGPGSAGELGAGVLVQGTPYLASYFASNGGEWILAGFYANPFNVPVGGLMPYLGPAAPNQNFALPFGQAISRLTYATLFGLTGTTFGAGDGTTTFNVPDLRGRAVFGQDNMGGAAASRITLAGGNFDGTVIGGSGGAQNHTLTTGEMPSHSHGVTDPGHTHTTTNSRANNNSGVSAGSGRFADDGSGFNINSATTGISIQNTGGGNAHSVLPPALVLPYILRII